MRTHYFQHVPFEGLGSIEARLKSVGFEISSTQFYQPWELPNHEDIDLLIALGGPMSINEEEEYPWLSQEKQYIRNSISMGKPVLGICLGAQLSADALGASAHQNKAKEIGWFPIVWTEDMAASTPGLKRQWMCYTGMVRRSISPRELYGSPKNEGCDNQGFKLGDSVIALQSHLESTSDSIEQIVKHCGEELVEAEFIQDRSAILDTPLHCYDQTNHTMTTILSRFTGRH